MKEQIGKLKKNTGHGGTMSTSQTHPYPSLTKGGRRKAAFTLAEVLITLGIIGVVAALTIPTLIQKYQERVWTTSFLRVYSLLENAYRMTQNEYGTFENWSGSVVELKDDNLYSQTLSDREALYNYMLKPNLEIAKAYVPGELDRATWDSLYASPVKNCWPNESYELDGTPLASNANGEYINRPAVLLKSGECIVLSYAYGDFIVDLNSKKGPNTLGKDQFAFSFDANKRERIKPGCFERWWTDNANYCDRTDNHSWHAGISCGFWIVRHHNMDYLHLPFDEIKKQWSGGVW